MSLSAVQIRRGTLVGIFTFLSSLLSGRASVTIAEEDGFIDLDLPISDVSSMKSGALKVTAKGTLKGQRVAIAVELDPTWHNKPVPNAGASFYWGNARLVSVGSESDSFVRVVSEMYGHPCSQAKMPKIVEAEAVGLANDPSRAREEPTKMKFFFNSSGAERDYAEVFINFDVPKRLLQFHEKDPDYREPLARVLCSAG